MEIWKTIESFEVLRAAIFRYVKIKRQSPTTLKTADFDLVQCSNWVNIIAITKLDEIVLVKQFRHGSNSITLEIPGGAVNFQEDPLTAAKRELQEETGYTAETWKHLGRVDANPAFMSNTCDTYLALNAEKTNEQNLDPFEEIEVLLDSKYNLSALISNKKITHSLIVAAIYFYQQEP
jgi:ADP-ribose pyrophosphatase